MTASQLQSRRRFSPLAPCPPVHGSLFSEPPSPDKTMRERQRSLSERIFAPQSNNSFFSHLYTVEERDFLRPHAVRRAAAQINRINANERGDDMQMEFKLVDASLRTPR